MNQVTVRLSADQLTGKLQQAFPFKSYFRQGTTAHAELLDTARSLLPNGGRVLDVGCGPADKTAVLSWAGYQCEAIDDFSDPWHREGDNLAKIEAFAKEAGVDLKIGDGNSLPYENETFDLIVLNHVIEHLQNGPRGLVNRCIDLLRPGGYIYISVPSAVNIRKRLAVLRGRTNYPPYGDFYWNEGSWRGHTREYTGDDLRKLAKFSGLEIASLQPSHHMVGALPKRVRKPYMLLTSVFKGWRDSWTLVGRKPENWAPMPMPIRGPRWSE